MIRPLFLSTYPPEACGLATFTKDSADAVDLAAGSRASSVVAIEKMQTHSGSRSRVIHTVENNQTNAYRLAAEVANSSSCDLVSLQHEFGLYPGEWGDRIMDFVHGCEKPVVTTFHTLLTNPDPVPRRIVRALAKKSCASVVMTRIAARLLVDVYGADESSIHVIPHGVPTAPFERDNSHRNKLGLRGKKVICTFGLINSGKGLEQMIRAMPKVVEACPNAVYRIVGITHPQVKRQEGEAYREHLIALAESLGVSEHVQFVNQYLSLEELLCHLQSCDVFVTPYPGKDQIASGTMAYAMATVGAVVSTPFLYAEELLANERGLLVPFGDSQAMAEATLRLLLDPVVLKETRLRAYEYAKPMFWPNVGRMYLKLFQQVVEANQISRVPLRLFNPLFDAESSENRLQKDI